MNPKNERHLMRGGVNKASESLKPSKPGTVKCPQSDCRRNRVAVKRWSTDRRRQLAQLRPRANGQSILVEALKPSDDVRIVLGHRGRFHAFVVVEAAELEQVADALSREVERRRRELRASSLSKESAVATGNRLRFLRERGQRDGYVAAFRDDGIDMRARDGRLQHLPREISAEHAALLESYRRELLVELEEIARTVAGKPRDPGASE